jgi:ADP-L-glycero-D-manno-heptose 6-epimerase
MTKNAFITGATGFIGHHLCNKLYEEGYRIIAVGRKDENRIKCNEFYTCNLNNIPWNDIPNIDICFHLGANNDTLEKNESLINNSNYYNAISLFKNLLNKNCEQFVYSSSCSVYGNEKTPFVEDKTNLSPLNLYSKSKLMFEKFAQDFAKLNKINCVGLRYTNVYGTHEKHKGHRASMIYQLIQKFHKNEKPKLFKDGEQKRDWVFVKDVVEANLLASKYNSSDIFNVGSGNTVSFNEIIKILQKATGKYINPEYIDCSFENSFQKNTTISLEKAKSKLKYSPLYKVDEGIQEIKVKIF